MGRRWRTDSSPLPRSPRQGWAACAPWSWSVGLHWPKAATPAGPLWLARTCAVSLLFLLLLLMLSQRVFPRRDEASPHLLRAARSGGDALRTLLARSLGLEALADSLLLSRRAAATQALIHSRRRWETEIGERWSVPLDGNPPRDPFTLLGREVIAASGTDGDPGQGALGRGPVAVCLVGAARDFELTGPSIIQRLLPAYHGTHLFLNSPLDHNSFKLRSLAWVPRNVTVAAIRIFRSTPMDESQYPSSLLSAKGSPNGTQGLLQYFRLVQGCIPLVAHYEAQQGLMFRWVLRTRVDTFWSRPPPPLALLNASAYTIPYGTDCFGYNDRLGVGTWRTSKPGLMRLDLLHSIRKEMAGAKGLNSEKSFKLQMEVTGTPVARQDFWFCVVSRREYKTHGMPVPSMASRVPLNGAKCRPCTPSHVGKMAVARLQRWHPSLRPGNVSEGLDLCDATGPWESQWEGAFDEAAGGPLAQARIAVMNSTVAECVADFDKLRGRAGTWDAPSPLELCVWRVLGQTEDPEMKRRLLAAMLDLATRTRSKELARLSTSWLEEFPGLSHDQRNKH